MSQPNNIDQERYFSDSKYRRRIAEESSKRSKSSSRLREALIAVGSTLIFGIMVISAYGFFLFQGLPSIDQLENPDTAIASEVRSRDGVVLDKYFTENRTWVRYQDISPHAINALISTEDHRFYDHWGMDMFRTLAIPINILRGRIEGGSTLSQQLARNLYKEIGQNFSVNRKFREMITAVQIEKNYTKKEIIEMYFNTVEYSNSAFGIEAASRTHFNKSAKNLNILEAATLVGSVNAVYAYNPRLFPERSKQRRNIVLRLMNRQKYISESEFQEYSMAEINLDYQPPSKSGRVNRYFGEYVRQKITPWAQENGYDLFTDGLVIHTTIDSRLQAHAERAIQVKLDSLQKIFELEWTSSESEIYMDRLWEKYPLF